MLKKNKGNKYTIDENEFNRLFLLYQHEVFTYAKRILKRDDLAEDLVQDVFSRIWSIRNSIDNPDSLKSLIYTITRNTAFNLLKRALNEKKILNEILYFSGKNELTTDNYMRTKFLMEKYQSIIQKMPKNRREIYKLSRLEGMSYKEISQEKNISVQTVKNQMSAALNYIRYSIKKVLETNL